MICASQKIKLIPVEDIFPNPYQVRKDFSVDKLKLLSASIKEVGVLSPVIVRKRQNGYELICGQRRLRASVMAGLKEIPAIVVVAGDLQCAQLSLIENLHRTELSDKEEGEGYYNMMFYHGLKKESLSKSVSVTPFTINEKIKPLSRRKSVEITKERPESIKSKETPEKSIIIKETKPKERRISELRHENSLKKSSLYENTVKRTAELLKKNGANTEFEKIDENSFTEFIIRVHK